MTSYRLCCKGGVGYTYVWKIENFAHREIKKGALLVSPSFTIPALGAEVEWILRVDLIGRIDAFAEFDLEKVAGQLNVTINCQICVCTFKGEVLHEFEKNGLNYRSVKYYTIGKLERGRMENLPDDILLIHCHVNGYDTGNNSNINCFARTNLQLHQRRIFYWKIDKFSSLLLREEKEYVLLSLNKGGPVLNLKLFLVGQTVDDASVQLTLKYSNVSGAILSTFVFYVMGVNGTSRKYLKEQILIDSNDNSIFFPHFFQRRELLAEDLPEDILTLRCEVTISGNNNSIENVVYGLNTQESTVEVAKPTGRPPSKKEFPSALSADMLSLLAGSGPPSDFELSVQGRSFPVHQLVLGARSAIFRAMFANDMLERKQQSLDLTDTDVDTVERLLRYVYADTHPPAGLAFRPLADLYVAADKYALMGLRGICAHQLVQGLNTTNAPDMLMLADRHRDQDLKEEVTGYISSRGPVVLECEEWKDLERENIQLAADTMRRIICEKFLMPSVESSEDSKGSGA